MFGLFKKAKTEVEKYNESKRNNDYNDFDILSRMSYEDFGGNNGLMVVEDVFTISGRGTVVTGMLNGGISVGDNVTILDNNGKIVKDATVVGIEKFRKLMDYAENENVGLLLRGVSKSDVWKGCTLM